MSDTWRSLRSLSSLASEMNPGAESVTTVMGPGCLIDVVKFMIPDFKSCAYSDGMMAATTKDVK